MIKENKKLKDLTFEEYANFKSFKCGYEGSCDKCVFRTGNCESPDSKDSWFNNKEMYSEAFLNQEIPVDKELLNEEDRKFLNLMYQLINVRNEEIYSICKCVDSFLGKKIGFIRIQFKSNVKYYGEERFVSPLFNPEERFVKLEINRNYKLEELGL